MTILTLSLSLSAFSMTVDEKAGHCMEMRYQKDAVFCLRNIGEELVSVRDACIDIRFKNKLELGSQYRRATMISFEAARMICRKESNKNPVYEQNCINLKLTEDVEQICN